MFAILKKIFKKKEDFSHLDSKGKATMVSVVEKERSHRVACARVLIKASDEVIEKLKQNDLKKGDAITVAMLMISALFFSINPLMALVKYAKKNPGKVTVSGAGLYVGHHIAFLQIQKETGVKLTYVPHKGGAPALKSVIGGQVMAGVNNLSDAYRSRDNLRILAIADNQRNKEFLPKVPTFKEQGYGVDDSSVNFRGIMVRKGTPKSVIDKLAEAFPKMFANPRVQKQMKNGGSPIRIMNRDEVREMWNKRQVFLEGLLKDL